ncbi:MAG: VWA domain-containing protein [Gammaproteobacteria bacterium]|nr:MAG: VWA domain-containing protein [Gammaproteobacteria bacterium]
MNFISPGLALLAAAIAVPLLVSLYFLKLRRRVMTISSTLLWKKAIQDMQVNAPFQRLRRSLLLLLQLLILGAALIAMARPTLDATAVSGQRTVIVIDHSASMNATDVSPNRLDHAKQAAMRLIDNLADGNWSDIDEAASTDGAMIVSFAQHAQVRQTFTNDPALLRNAVRMIEPTDQISLLGPALRLIEPYANSSDGNLVVYVISDGRIRDQNLNLSLSGATLKYIPIGQSDITSSDDTDNPGNVGIISFTARRDFDKPEIVQVFAKIANFGHNPIKANLTLSLDDRPIRVQPIQLAAATSTPHPSTSETSPSTNIAAVKFDFVLPGTGLLTLSHDYQDDLLVDNTARLTLAPARRLRVLLVTKGNAFLERGIRSSGVRRLALMTPEKFENQTPETLRRGDWESSGLTGEGYDVIVFDSYSPNTIPLVNSIYFASAPPIKDIQRVAPRDDGDEQAERLLEWDRSHPLLRYVSLDDVIVSRPGRLVVSANATVLITGRSGPVMAEVIRDGVRHVVVSFDVLRSNWPIKISFPVFLGNIMQTLVLGGMMEGAGVSYHTGDIVSIPIKFDRPITYNGPDTLTVRRTQGASVLPPFRRAGVYEAQTTVDPPYDLLSVNLLDPSESDIPPASVLNVSTMSGNTSAHTAGIQREIWQWFIWAALGVMLIEWLIYTRRMHL